MNCVTIQDSQVMLNNDRSILGVQTRVHFEILVTFQLTVCDTNDLKQKKLKA